MNTHRPRKRFGQHFLVDQAIINRIVSLISPQTGEKIVEIGPGEGVLTEHLIASGADVSAIEIDRDLVAKLSDRFAGQRNFHIINSDVLKVDFAQHIGTNTAHVVGNLPYNISTPLLVHLFSAMDRIDKMTFMLQREVVERMCAHPGSGTFGRLSILTQTHCQAENLLLVPPAAFVPPPKVDSSVVRLVPVEQQLTQAVAARLAEITQAAFSQRRKKIKSGLKKLCSTEELYALGIDPDARPDALGIEVYVALADYLVQRQ